MTSTILGKDQPIKRVLHPFRIKQALVALELGKTDDSIINYLQFLSNQIPVEKTSFLHVIPDFSLLTALYEKTEGGPFNKFDLKEVLAQELEAKINEYYFTEEWQNIQHTILEGNPLEQLLKNAQNAKADLIVIGQDSEKKYHSILGKNLARKTKGNTLIIPDTTQATLSQIMVPFDFSENSKRALDTAIGINQQLAKPVKIVCLHIYEMPNYNQFKISRPLENYQGMVESFKREAFDKLLLNIDPVDRSFIETKLIAKDLPGIAKYIMEGVIEFGADLIVIGAKGHSKVDLLFMGSVTERLLTLNKAVPTLIVK